MNILMCKECCLTIEAMLEPDGTKRVTLQELCRSRYLGDLQALAVLGGGFNDQLNLGGCG